MLALFALYAALHGYWTVSNATHRVIPFVRHGCLTFDVGNTVYNRAETLMKPGAGFVGYPWAALRQAWFSECADRLVAVLYDSLVRRPRDVIGTLYDTLGEKQFVHDFDRIHYEEQEFDARLGLAGFHTVESPVRPKPRETILPRSVPAVPWWVLGSTGSKSARRQDLVGCTVQVSQ